MIRRRLRRRLLAWSSLGLLSACVSSAPPANYPPPLPAPGPAPAPQPAPPPQPSQPAPTPQPPSGDMQFDDWRRDFLANRAGRWRDVLGRELAGMSTDARVITQDLGQPEFSVPVSTYLGRTVTADRIANGRAAMATVPQLSAIEAQYGVPREILVAVWGMETAFGRIMGSQDVLRSLATLAAQGRRRAWAEAQLVAAAEMIGEGHASRQQLKGSWAGAMGHTQFIPATYLDTAVDGNGDGRRDIWGSPADALASAANLLRKAGWRPGGSWAVEVVLPASGFDYSVTESLAAPPSEWQRRGVRRADGRAWSDVDQSSEARLILPAGASGPAFLTFPNHMAIRAYNNSTSYALAVGMLADALQGQGGVRRPWPAEQPLSIVDRRAAQAALAQLGFSPGAIDGVVGAGTRAALRQWQAARGRPDDGYLDAATVAALRREANL